MSVINLDHSSVQKVHVIHTQEAVVKPVEFKPEVPEKDYTDILKQMIQSIDALGASSAPSVNLEVKLPEKYMEVQSRVPEIHVAPSNINISYRKLALIAAMPTIAILCDVLSKFFL